MSFKALILPANFSPKGLYIHIPFCASRCPYCDFFVIVSRREQRHLRLAQRLLEQLDSYLEQRPALLDNLETIYLGGGTPSLLGAQTLSYLLLQLRRRLPNPAKLCELSMESNPELIHPESLELWQQLGITRLSIGLQSCGDKLLRTLGRRATQRQHQELATILPRYFSGQYSFDFIYGIPGQLPSDIDASLEFISRHQPHHISYYELSIEEGSYFARQNKLTRATGTESERQFYRLNKGLARLGYQRYEVANWARAPEYQCRHNLLYWRWQAYLGLGPGAVGAALLPQAPAKGPMQARVWRAQGPHDSRAWHSYMQRENFGVQFQTLEAAESLWEYLLMALRRRSGIEACEAWQLLCPYQPSQPPKFDALLQELLPQTMRRYADFFYRQDGYLKMNDRGFDLQGAFLRTAQEELLSASA